MELPNRTLAAALPAVNLVALFAAVAVLWWRAAVVEDQVQALRGAVNALQVEVAVLHQTIKGR